MIPKFSKFNSRSRNYFQPCFPIFQSQRHASRENAAITKQNQKRPRRCQRMARGIGETMPGNGGATQAAVAVCPPPISRTAAVPRPQTKRTVLMPRRSGASSRDDVRARQLSGIPQQSDKTAKRRLGHPWANLTPTCAVHDNRACGKVTYKVMFCHNKWSPQLRMM